MTKKQGSVQIGVRLDLPTVPRDHPFDALSKAPRGYTSLMKAAFERGAIVIRKDVSRHFGQQEPGGGSAPEWAEEPLIRLTEFGVSIAKIWDGTPRTRAVRSVMSRRHCCFAGTGIPAVPIRRQSGKYTNCLAPWHYR